MFFKRWGAAYEKALTTFPAPVDNGYYGLDKNAKARLCECWRIIIETGVPVSEEPVFLKNLSGDTCKFTRSYVVEIARVCGLKTNRVPIRELVAQLWDKARRIEHDAPSESTAD